MRSAALAAVLMLVPGLARAAEPPAGTQERWYGWQTELVDAASLLSGLGGFVAYLDPRSRDSATVLMGLGVCGYTLGAPMVHVGHARPLTALADFGLRVGAPAGLGLLGYAASGRGSEVGGAALGIIFGVVGAVAVDAQVLARETVPAAAAFVPTIVPRRGGVDLGIHATW